MATLPTHRAATYRAIPFLVYGLGFAVLYGAPSQAVWGQNTIAISPDGRWVAYDVRDTLWLARAHPGVRPAVVAEGSSYYFVPRWSPRSDQLTYYAASSGSTQLWLYDVRKQRRRQLSAVDGGISPDLAGRFVGWSGDPLIYGWSPDGSTIAFASEVVRVDTPPPHRADSMPWRPSLPESLAAGRPLVLTRTTPPDWTLHGVIAFHSGHTVKAGRPTEIDDATFSPPRTTQLFLLDVKSGRSRPLTHDTAGYFTPDWSPDGHRLAYMSPEGRSLAGFGPEESDIFVLDAGSGRSLRLTSGPRQKTLPRWSPDGRWVAYLSRDRLGSRTREAGVYVVPGDGRAPPRRVTAGIDREPLGYAWAPDGASLLAIFRDGISLPLAQVDVRTGAVTWISPPQAIVHDVVASRRAASWVQTLDPNAAKTLMVRGRRDPTARPVVDLLPEADSRAARRQEAIRWTNSRGEKIEGVVIYPVGYRPGSAYPMIVDTYGVGLNARWTDEYDLIKISSPYVVFRPNHRAPHLWGTPVKDAAYDSAAAGPGGIAVMADDILSGVDTLVRRGVSDPARMCIFGFSNGGLEGEQLLTQTDRFKCAVLQSPAISDWALEFFLSSDDPAVVRWMYGIAPWQEPALYTALIPLYHADKVTTPVLLAVGDKESLLLLATIEMYNALRYLKKDVTLLRYADQGHGFTGAAEADFQGRARSFFAKWLGP
jgi:dipeptidyl aminopeptidase/acylaminoacyl peptidase